MLRFVEAVGFLCLTATMLSRDGPAVNIYTNGKIKTINPWAPINGPKSVVRHTILNLLSARTQVFWAGKRKKTRSKAKVYQISRKPLLEIGLPQGFPNRPVGRHPYPWRSHVLGHVTRSLLDFVEGLPPLRFPVCEHHSRICWPHRPSAETHCRNLFP